MPATSKVCPRRLSKVSKRIDRRDLLILFVAHDVSDGRADLIPQGTRSISTGAHQQQSVAQGVNRSHSTHSKLSRSKGQSIGAAACYNPPMTPEKILLHQVHPLKLAADVIAAVVSLYFFWQHQLVAGLVTHLVPPVVASAAVLHFADLSPYKNSRLGAYLERYMTLTVQAIRLAGDLITVIAAWYHSAAGIAAGVAVILAAWTYGLLPLRHS